MNGWFIALIVLYVLELGATMSKHGEPKTGKYNFWSTLITLLILMFVIVKAIQTGF